MDDALPVGELEAVRDLDRDADGVAGPQRPAALDPLLQRAAGQVLHHDERGAVDLAHVVDGDDVRMRELRERARLLDEHPSGLAIGGGRGIEDLDRDLAVEGGVLGEVDLRRASGPDRLDDPVAALQNALESQFRSPPRRADYTARSVGYYVRKRVCHRPPPPHSPATTRTPTQARPLLVPIARRRLPLVAGT